MNRLKSLLISVSLICSITLASYAKQTSEMPPGTAAIANIKTAIHSGQIAATAARDALPLLLKNADAGDTATANGILNDVDKGLSGRSPKDVSSAANWWPIAVLLAGHVLVVLLGVLIL